MTTNLILTIVSTIVSPICIYLAYYNFKKKRYAVSVGNAFLVGIILSICVENSIYV